MFHTWTVSGGGLRQPEEVSLESLCDHRKHGPGSFAKRADLGCQAVPTGPGVEE